MKPQRALTPEEQDRIDIGPEKLNKMSKIQLEIFPTTLLKFKYLPYVLSSIMMTARSVLTCHTHTYATI